MRAMKITWRGGGKQRIPRGIYKEPKQGWTGWRFFIACRSQLGGVYNSCQSSGETDVSCTTELCHVLLDLLKQKVKNTAGHH